MLATGHVALPPTHLASVFLLRFDYTLSTPPRPQIFTIEYVARFYCIGEEERYAGCQGRYNFFFSFFSLVDLISIVPYYIDLSMAGDNIPASQFIRLARVLRMMTVDDRAGSGLSDLKSIFTHGKELLITGGFVGVGVWIIFASLYYMVERNNPAMIICTLPYPPTGNKTFDMTKTCWNRFHSIPASMYFTLVNLFGEFPLADDHSPGGKAVGTILAVIAVAVFAIPVGVIGSGFEELAENAREEKKAEEEAAAAKAAHKQAMKDKMRHAGGHGSAFQGLVTEVAKEQTSQQKRHAHLEAMTKTTSGRVWLFINGDTRAGLLLEYFIYFLIGLNVTCFMVATLPDVEAAGLNTEFTGALWFVELVSVLIFTIEYGVRISVCGMEERFAGCKGKLRFIFSFFSLVDLISIVPFYIDTAMPGRMKGTTFVRALRLLRVFRTGDFRKMVGVFHTILVENSQILSITGMFAAILWVLASAVMFYTERENPVANTRSFYTSVPTSMWMTLLNLSGEVPLCDYTPWGKVVNGFIGVVATGLFALPIGIIGTGFEDFAEEMDEEDDSDDADADDGDDDAEQKVALTGVDEEEGGAGGLAGAGEQRKPPATCVANLYSFVEAETRAGVGFNIFVYVLIFISITLVIIGTLPDIKAMRLDDYTPTCAPVNGTHGEVPANASTPDANGCVVMAFPGIFWIFELVSVVVFTIEYLLRWFAASEDPAYAHLAAHSPWLARLRYTVSFYAIIDKLAIVPYYLSFISADIGRYDDYLRIFRILRLLKLDKFVPSISLIDDVFRAKKAGLMLSTFVMAVLWILFSTLFYLTESGDHEKEIGIEQSVRYGNVFNALQYSLIHLTGDYPLTKYTLAAKIIHFFNILCAVAVVSLPQGIIANGFVEILTEQKKGKPEPEPETKPPQPSGRSSTDSCQERIYAFLNGKRAETKTAEEPSKRFLWWSYFFRHTILALILLNVLAVLLESMKEVKEFVGPTFEIFEGVSVVIFTVEYILRMFSVVKDANQNYSRCEYATTFFGIVDLMAIAPWYIELILVASGIHFDGAIFRVFRIFRFFQLEHFVTAFTKLDDVFRQCKDVLKAAGGCRERLRVVCVVCVGVVGRGGGSGGDEQGGRGRGAECLATGHRAEVERAGAYRRWRLRRADVFACGGGGA